MKKEPIRLRTIIEVLGKPASHVNKAIKGYVKKIKEDGRWLILSEDFAEIKKQGNMFSTFVELELIAKSLDDLISFCFEFMPSSVEILKPEKLCFTAIEASNFFNDLQARLHQVDMVAKKLHNENKFLKRNLNFALKNVITLLLTFRPNLNLKEISKFSGIKEEELKILLGSMVKEGKIKKIGEVYRT